MMPSTNCLMQLLLVPCCRQARHADCMVTAMASTALSRSVLCLERSMHSSRQLPGKDRAAQAKKRGQGMGQGRGVGVGFLIDDSPMLKLPWFEAPALLLPLLLLFRLLSPVFPDPAGAAWLPVTLRLAT